MKRLSLLMVGIGVTGVLLAGCSSDKPVVEESNIATESVVTSEEATTMEESSEVETATTEALTENTTADAVDFMKKVKTAVQNKDMDAFADLCAYPVYVGIGEGSVVNTKEELTALGADEIFTEELVKTITSVDENAVEEVEAGYVMSNEEGKPNITLNTSEEGVFGITGINY